jgi:hypothetical protein
VEKAWRFGVTPGPFLSTYRGVTLSGHRRVPAVDL